MNDPRGSLFRKWDLHVHTPASVLEQKFGGDWDDYVTRLIASALDERIVVVGVTDYFSISGYKRLRRDYLDNSERLRELLGNEAAERAAALLFLPCVEFRVPPLIDDGKRVGLHVIFSSEVNPDDIEQNFLHQLRFRYASAPQTSDQQYPLTPDNLERLGKRLKEDHPQFQNRTDHYVGMMNALVDDHDISKELVGKPDLFRGKYLLGVVADESLSRINWDSGGHQVRKTLIQKSDFLLSSNPGTVEFGLGRRHPSPGHFVQEFRSLKPCLWGSDAKDYARLFHPAGDRHLWIKADTTFEGLRQAIREPRRVYIGSDPPEVIAMTGAARSRLIDRVLIQNTEPLPSGELWFTDTDVPLNPGLVVIIGNRGSGKSALSDAIGLAGSTHNFGYFSFLSSQGFRRGPENKARYFEAQLCWADGNSSPPRPLAENPEPDSPLRVQYIPQFFLEHLCANPEEDPFEHELDRVMFALIPEQDRENSSSLAALLASKRRRHEEAIRRLHATLSEVNERIHDLELAMSTERATELRRRRDLVAQSIVAHYSDRPKSADPGFQLSTARSEGLGTLQSELERLESALDQLREESASLGRQVTELEAFTSDLDQLEADYIRMRETHSQALRAHELKLEEVVKLEIQRGLVSDRLSDLSTRRRSIAERLDPDNDGSDAQRAAEIQRQIQEIREALDGPERIVEENRRRVRAWRQELHRLIGTREDAESLEGLSYRLLEQARLLPTRLFASRKHRIETARRIHERKLAIVEVHRSVYQPVVERMSRAEALVETGLPIGVLCHLRPQQVSAELLSYIDRGARGYFQHIPESEVAMGQLVDSTQWDSPESVCTFLEGVVYRLEQRDPEDLSGIGRQMRQGMHLEFYDRLFGLEYLQPTSELTVSGKDLRALSPGERGAALLVFYLVLDKSDIPLVIDQPEANLDNESVVDWLVGFLRDARKRRQIVLVTHNPNIAVVADADQIVRASIDRGDRCRVTYTTGSIENPRLNLFVVDILEGTLPAFDNRDEKYDVTRNRSS